MVLRIDTSAIVSLALESTLWGASVTMFALTLYIVCRGRSFREINHWNVARASILFVSSTIHIAANGCRTVNAFIKHAQTPGGPQAYLAIYHTESLYMCIAYCLQTLIGDAIVIHRSYVVWQSLWIIAIPLVLWLGVFALTVIVINSVRLMLFARNPWLHSQLSNYMIMQFSLTLASNLISTALLAYKIHKVNSVVTRSRTNAIQSVVYPVMRTAIDAGVLYTLLIVTAIINQAVSTDPFIITCVIVPSISIIFYMFIMRIALAQTFPTTSVSGKSSSSSGVRVNNFKPPPKEIHLSASKMTDSSASQDVIDVKYGV